MGVFIDIEIWSIAQKEPSREKFESQEEFIEAVKMHMKAKEFLESILQKEIIYMTYHQVAEIYHVLGFRGRKLPLDYVSKFITKILESERIIKVPIELDRIKLAIKLSKESGIHAWDFLCVIPILDHISIAYTVDIHFTHEIFQKLGLKVRNPLGKWISI